MGVADRLSGCRPIIYTDVKAFYRWIFVDYIGSQLV
jgi:hypothetical protein